MSSQQWRKLSKLDLQHALNGGKADCIDVFRLDLNIALDNTVLVILIDKLFQDASAVWRNALC